MKSDSKFVILLYGSTGDLVAKKVLPAILELKRKRKRRCGSFFLKGKFTELIITLEKIL